MQALNFFSFDMYSKAFANMFGAECQSAKFAAGACAGGGQGQGGRPHMGGCVFI